MRVTVENGKAIKVTGDPEHPPTQGVRCARKSADMPIVFIILTV
jgi:anaerobic selenocysteine-containing dehydrogenase